MSTADPSSSTAPSPAAAPPTILQSLTSLLASLPQPSLHTAHPYAPTPSWKGKAREIAPAPLEEQARVLREVRTCLQELGGVLRADEGGSDGRARLARGLRDVVTNSQPLMPLLSIPFLPPPPAYHPCLPPAYILLPPPALLSHLATTLGLTPYLEDSQFGLLKSSIALAGERFVLDVDLETDPLAGADEGEPDDENNNSTPTGEGPGLGMDKADGRGKVRLAKLKLNVVLSDGNTGDCESVEGVLRGRVERWLEVWNEGDRGGRRLGEAVEGLRGELAEVKGVDELAQQGERERFGEIDRVVKRLKEWFADPGVGICATTHEETIFPTFTLLPTFSRLSTPCVFRLRPARTGEEVPPPPWADAAMQEGWTEGRWVVEHVGEGLIVREGWLEASKLPEEEDEEARWTGGAGAEQLLYAQASASQAITFPYGSTFVHGPESISTSSVGTKKPLEQHWSVGVPGPPGLLVGRVGIPATTEDTLRLLDTLRAQVVLNELLLSVLRPASLRGNSVSGIDGVEDGDEEMELDDLLAAPKAIPLSMTLARSAIHIDLPLPSSGTSIRLTVSPAKTATRSFDVSWHSNGAELPPDVHQDLDESVRRASQVEVLDLPSILAACLGPPS